MQLESDVLYGCDRPRGAETKFVSCFVWLYISEMITGMVGLRKTRTESVFAYCPVGSSVQYPVSSLPQ